MTPKIGDLVRLKHGETEWLFRIDDEHFCLDPKLRFKKTDICLILEEKCGLLRYDDSGMVKVMIVCNDSIDLGWILGEKLERISP
jgi:hypothetical protein